MGPDAMDHVVQLCASWRNRRWWEEQKNLKLGDWKHPRVGRVLRRWEDVFVEFRGLQWAVIMSKDPRVWMEKLGKCICVLSSGQGAMQLHQR